MMVLEEISRKVDLFFSLWMIEILERVETEVVEGIYFHYRQNSNFQ